MKVLDVGSGAGDVALLLAELIGPQGQVVGVDTNAEILQVARSRVQAIGWTTVSFRPGDIMELDLDQDFDAVVGRWLLQYMPDPVALLRRARSWLRPGGIVAFQEIDLSIPPRGYPTGPLHEQVMRWTTPPPGAPAAPRYPGRRRAQLAGLRLCGRDRSEPPAVPGAGGRGGARRG